MKVSTELPQVNKMPMNMTSCTNRLQSLYQLVWIKKSFKQEVCKQIVVFFAKEITLFSTLSYMLKTNLFNRQGIYFHPKWKAF